MFTSIILICYYKILKSEIRVEIDINITTTEIIISAIVILIWLLFSGIGNFSYQNDDWEVRNAVLRDLINYEWPVIYSTEDMIFGDENLKEIDNIGFVYYFTYWLPAALIGKVFGLTVANIFLYIWTFLILITILYLMKIFLKKNTYLILYFLIFFSGMDILGAIVNGSKILGIDHIEWWCDIIQYSSNTTQLYWVFNQSVMSWLITMLILTVKKESSILTIAPMIFCYSPFATFGIIPIVGYLIINKILKGKCKKEKFVKLMFSFEILNVLAILLVFGTYYLSADSTIIHRGVIFNLDSIEIDKFFIIYLLFCIVEFIVYIFLMIKKYNDGLFKIICIELMLIPFYKMTVANDFCMRSSIVPLFVLMLYFIKYVSEIKSKKIIEQTIVIVVVIVSIITPLHEIFRSVYYTTNSVNKYSNIKEQIIYSIGNPITKKGFDLCNEQFYNKTLEREFFSKYLLKNH